MAKKKKVNFSPIKILGFFILASGIVSSMISRSLDLITIMIGIVFIAIGEIGLKDKKTMSEKKIYHYFLMIFGTLMGLSFVGGALYMDALYILQLLGGSAYMGVFVIPVSIFLYVFGFLILREAFRMYKHGS
jgi:hypothetical protein